MYCCMAGSADPLTPPLPSKLNLDGFSLEEPMLNQPITSDSLLHLTKLLSSLVMTSYASSGRQKKAQRIKQISLLKSVPLFDTFKKPTPVLKLVIS